MKYAVVTGASSGIGWHLAEALAQCGYAIIAVSNQPSGLEALKKKLEQVYKVSVDTINMNLALENSAERIFDYCEKHDLKVEILVNNAGMLVYGETAKVDYNRVKTILQLQMTTPALLCRLFGEKMIMRGKGFILNVSSISSVMPYPTISLYGPTKSFLRQFTRALRTELKPSGINVTCLLPGATDTPLFEQYQFNRTLARKLGVLKKPEKVAKAAINALKNNRPEYIPGFLNKLAIRLLPLLPYFIIRLIYTRKRDS
jgi:short-subunit dehydrogenase